MMFISFSLGENVCDVLASLMAVLSQNSIFGQNPKIGCQEFNDLQTPKLSKKQLCDRTVPSPLEEAEPSKFEAE
jgi:hypothetical protein